MNPQVAEDMAARAALIQSVLVQRTEELTAVCNDPVFRIEFRRFVMDYDNDPPGVMGAIVCLVLATMQALDEKQRFTRLVEGVRA